MRLMSGRRLRFLTIPATLAVLTVPATAHGAVTQAAAPRVSGTIVRVENPSSRIGPGTPAVTQVRLGESVRVIIYGYFTNLQAVTKAGVGLTVSNSTRPLFLSRGTFNVARIDGTAPGWRWFYNVVRPCTAPPQPLTNPQCIPQTPGRYRLDAFIGLAGTQYAKSTSFVVVQG